MPSASLVKEFENLIGKENVFTSEADRQSYAYDAAVLPSVVPGLVLRPTSSAAGPCPTPTNPWSS